MSNLPPSSSLGVLAEFQNFQLAEFIGQSLAGPGDVTVHSAPFVVIQRRIVVAARLRRNKTRREQEQRKCRG
jgi:hypothetical protein